MTTFSEIGKMYENDWNYDWTCLCQFILQGGTARRNCWTEKYLHQSSWICLSHDAALKQELAWKSTPLWFLASGRRAYANAVLTRDQWPLIQRICHWSLSHLSHFPKNKNNGRSVLSEACKSLQVVKECREDSNAKAEKDSFCHPNILSRLQRSCTLGTQFDVATQEGTERILSSTRLWMCYLCRNSTYLPNEWPRTPKWDKVTTASYRNGTALRCRYAKNARAQLGAFAGTPDMIHVVDMLQLPHCENEFK